MYEGYLTLAGVELVNNERAAAYARNLGITTINCPPCTIAPAVGDLAYVLPQPDSAPWYDPAAPESAGFAGVFGLSVRGFDSSPITRNPIARLGDGAVITRARYNAREVVYSCVAMAVDRCSLSYGLAWLSTALRGSTCQPCGGSNACAYTCCPTPETENATVRTMAQVGVLEGPLTSRVANLRSTCGTGASPVLAEIEFTLAMGRPWLYRAPITVVGGVTLDDLACEGYTWARLVAHEATWNDVMADYSTWSDVHPDRVIWNAPDCPRDPDEYDQFGCPRQDARTCAQDPQRLPNCPEPPSPPTVPRPYDPCGICYDGPDTMTASFNVPPDLTPMWMDQVPLVEISTGETPVRALVLRFYANPTGQDTVCDPGRLDPCTACATMAIPYIPGGATLTIDGRDFTASLDCDGGRGNTVLDDAQGIFGPNGRPYSWPVFDCNGFCVSITVPCDFPIDEVALSVSVVAREDAA